MPRLELDEHAIGTMASVLSNLDREDWYRLIDGYHARSLRAFEKREEERLANWKRLEEAAATRATEAKPTAKAPASKVKSAVKVTVKAPAAKPAAPKVAAKKPIVASKPVTKPVVKKTSPSAKAKPKKA